MSLEQWGILALVILLPLLEGVARVVRSRTRQPENAGPGDHVAQTPVSRRWMALPNSHGDDDVRHVQQTAIRPPPPMPPPLPQPASALVLARPAGRATSSAGLRSREGEPSVRWLRPTRNLRRAIILATILGRPSQS